MLENKDVKGNFYTIENTPPKCDSEGGKSFSRDGTLNLLLHKTHHLSELNYINQYSIYYSCSNLHVPLRNCFLTDFALF